MEVHEHLSAWWIPSATLYEQSPSSKAKGALPTELKDGLGVPHADRPGHEIGRVHVPAHTERDDFRSDCDYHDH